ncbi:MAG: hypothetical protein ABSH28_07635, partial [Acidobacteriota bacterium]
VGWRQIIENKYRTATLTEWHNTKGRHKIYAKGKAVELETTKHDLLLPQEPGCSRGLELPQGEKETVPETKAP